MGNQNALAVRQTGQVSNILLPTKNALENFTRAAESPVLAAKGINALTLIPSSPLTETDLTMATVHLEANFGTKYSREKMLLLFNTLSEDGWTKERFARTLSWFIRNKQFPAWTIADWYNYEIPIYPISERERKGLSFREINLWRLSPDTVAFTLKDGNELPFQRVMYTAPNFIYCNECEIETGERAMYDTERTTDHAHGHVPKNRMEIYP